MTLRASMTLSHPAETGPAPHRAGRRPLPLIMAALAAMIALTAGTTLAPGIARAQSALRTSSIDTTQPIEITAQQSLEWSDADRVATFRGDVKAVVHAHPPTATAFAVAGVPLDRPIIAEAVVTLGPVPVIPYGTPSTHELADNVGDAICDAHALLLANHGALAVGDDAWRAWERMETVEQLARISLLARQLGGGNTLPERAVERLQGLRSSYGYPPPSCATCPDCGSDVPVGDGDRMLLSRAEIEELIAAAVQELGPART